MAAKKAAAKQSPSSKTLGILKSLKPDDWVKIVEKIVEVSTPVSSEWLVANGFPADLHRAVRIALKEYGEFATSDDIREFEMGSIRELLQTVVDHRQWMAKTKPVGKRSVETPWTEDEETEARRLIQSGKAKTANVLREMLSMNRTAAQALFRQITGKQKKKHRIE